MQQMKTLEEPGQACSMLAMRARTGGALRSAACLAAAPRPACRAGPGGRRPGVAYGLTAGLRKIARENQARVAAGTLAFQPACANVVNTQAFLQPVDKGHRWSADEHAELARFNAYTPGQSKSIKHDDE